MNYFNEHPRQQGISYWQHLQFALGIAGRLFKSVIAFSLHAVFPFLDISRKLDLEETASFILTRNEWIENIKQEKQHGQARALLDEDIEGNSHPAFKIISA